MEDEEIMSKYMMNKEMLGESEKNYQANDQPFLFSNKHTSFLSIQTEETELIPDSIDWTK
jgi:hypothetical protein